MKYTVEQLKDLIYLSKKGCLRRVCWKCMWKNEFCKLLMIKNVLPETEMTSTRIKHAAKEMIRESIGL